MRAKGFTLIEVMMALLLTSILVVSISVALCSVIRTQSITKAHSDQLKSMQIAMSMISDDLRHSIEQSFYDGSQRWPAFVGTNDDMVFVRFGEPGPVVVKYELLNHVFTRGVQSYVDSKKGKLNSSVLLDAVSEASDAPVFRYLGEDLLFYDVWPAPANNFHSSLPRAVQVGFHVPGWGDITQFFLLPPALGLVCEY